MSITGVENDQEKGHSQEILVTKGIEVPVIVDRGLDLDLVLIEIGYDVIIVENMTILREIFPIPERKRPRTITTDAAHGSQGTNSSVG